MSVALVGAACTSDHGGEPDLPDGALRDGGGPNEHDGAPGDAGELDASPREDAGRPDARDGGPEHDAALRPDAGTDPGFTPFPGLDDPGLARRIGDEHWLAAQTLHAHADGTSWLLWRSYNDPDFSRQTIHLDHFDARGVHLRSWPLGTLDPNGMYLDATGAPTLWRNRCGANQADTCFYQETAAGDVTERVWPAQDRSGTRYQLDWSGNITGTSAQTYAGRTVSSVLAGADATYAFGLQGSYVLRRLDGNLAPLWESELLPLVWPPEVPIDGPLDDLLRAAALSRQTTSNPVAVDDGVVVAVAASRGCVAALNAERGLSLPLSSDPLCSDIVVANVSSDGTQARYWAVPTPLCENLPKLAVVGHHAVVASSISVEKEPAPNDTFQYDIAVGIVDLTSGDVTSQIVAFHEDDIVNAIARCGERACLAGVTGARSVNTGSTVTFGEGFVLPLGTDGTLGRRVRLTSARHSEIRDLSAGGDALWFFATVDGPITHTADQDRWLGYNKGLLGVFTGL